MLFLVNNYPQRKTRFGIPTPSSNAHAGLVRGLVTENPTHAPQRGDVYQVDQT